ncbi:MAG: NnrU family protein [Pseudomonadota bacterium]
MGYLTLIAGIAIFVASHIFTTLRGPRQALIDRIGPLPYKALYSIVALIGFVLIVRGWRLAPADVLYVPPFWLTHVTAFLMWPAFVFLVAAYVPAGKIKGAVKHPMILAVKVWAFAHLLANGEVASLILFVSFLAWAVYDRISLKRRGDDGPGMGPARNDFIAAAVGTVAYAVFAVWLHPILIGVAAVG